MILTSESCWNDLAEWLHTPRMVRINPVLMLTTDPALWFQCYVGQAFLVLHGIVLGDQHLKE